MATNFQFAVLSALLGGQMEDQALRSAVADRGYRSSLASFFRRMAEMEDAGQVEGWYEHDEIDGLPVKCRWYRITDRGRGDHEERVRADAEIEAGRLGWAGT